MRTKWLLLALPLAIFAVLLQSSLWTPTYASQANGNPKRLVTFIRSELADPTMLNPILASDGGALDLMHENIFEGLVGADENMRLSPKLADSWTITEDAFLAVMPERKLPGGEQASAANLKKALNDAWTGKKLGSVGESILRIDLVPTETRKHTETALVKNAKGKNEPVDVELSIDVPERVRFRLSKVEPDLFKTLESVVGADYFAKYPFAGRFKAKKPEQLALVQGKLPEILPIGEHNPILEFKLHQGVKWQDGEPFTADDVKFTYEAVLDPKNASPRTSYFDSVKGFEAPDPYTARVTYSRLYSSAVIAWAAMEILPKHLLDAAALEREMNATGVKGAKRKTFSVRSSSFNRHPIGTGPFRFEEWQQDQFIRLSRFDGYWGEKPEVESFYWRTIPDYLTAELEFGAGALDIYKALPHQAERYRHDPHYQVVSSTEGYYAYIGYNARKPLFQDPKIRRALGMAIDVDSIIKYVLSGEGRRATGPYYATTPYYDPQVKPLPFDPAGAERLFAEAGWHKNSRGILEKDGKPFEFTLVTNNANPQRKAIMTVAQEAWRRIGVDCKIQAFEWTVLLADFIDKLSFDAVVMAWGGGDMDPDKFSIWHSSQTEPFQLNFSGYKSAEADALIEKIQKTYDSEQQIQLAHAFHRRLAEDQPYTFLYEPLKPIVFDRRLRRVEHTPQGEKLHKLAAPPSGDAFFYWKQWRKQLGKPSLEAN